MTNPLSFEDDLAFDLASLPHEDLLEVARAYQDLLIRAATNARNERAEAHEEFDLRQDLTLLRTQMEKF